MAEPIKESREVTGTKMDKITYDENFIILTQSDGSQIAIGELDEGFQEFEKAMRTSLDGFPQDWYAIVESQPAGEYVRLWAR